MEEKSFTEDQNLQDPWSSKAKGEGIESDDFSENIPPAENFSTDTEPVPTPLVENFSTDTEPVPTPLVENFSSKRKNQHDSQKAFDPEIVTNSNQAIKAENNSSFLKSNLPKRITNTKFILQLIAIFSSLYVLRVFILILQ